MTPESGSYGARLLGLAGDRVLLASRSPRRAELLTRLGLPITVRPAEVPEIPAPGESPAATAERLAAAKVRALEPGDGHDWILGADTVVVLEGEVLGQPGDDTEAREMLRRLSGREHEVLTAVAVLRTRNGVFRSGVERTRVRFRELPETEIEILVASGEARDKAGAYGIQGLGALVVTGIEGDYYAVMGLPLGLLRRLIEEVRAA